MLSINLIISYPSYSLRENLKGENNPNTTLESLDVYLLSPNPATEGLTLPNLKASLPSDSKPCYCITTC